MRQLRGNVSIVGVLPDRDRLFVEQLPCIAVVGQFKVDFDHPIRPKRRFSKFLMFATIPT